MITGIIREGSKHARAHGYPTANILIDRFEDRPGTYAAHARVQGKTYPAASFISNKEGQWVCETHLLDLDLDLYGERMEIELLSFVSDIDPFESFEQMQEKIDNDITEVRNYHNE